MAGHSPVEWVSVNEAAKLYGCHRSNIIYHLNRGHLTYRKTETGYILIDLRSLNALHLKNYDQPLGNTVRFALWESIV